MYKPLPDNLRLGFLNMQTDQDLNNGISANNNLVLTLQQKVFTRSNIGLIYINRQKTGNSNTTNNQEKFNRVLGLDYNLLSKNSIWTANIHAHNSFSETKKNNPYSIGSLIIVFNLPCPLVVVAVLATIAGPILDHDGIGIFGWFS